MREIRKPAVLDMVHFVEYMVSRLRIHSFGRKPCYKEAYSESTNYMELDWRLARSYKGKSESFRPRFVLFAIIRSADFPLFPSGPARPNSGSKLGQEQGTPNLLAWRPKFFLRGGMAHAIIKVQSQVRYYDPASVNVPKGRLKELTLLLHDERNGLERVLLHFSHFEKETQKLDERLYRITLQ